MTETPEPEKPPLTPLRTFVAAMGVLTMVLAGGCTLTFLFLVMPYWDAIPVVLLYGVPGLLAGLVVYLLAVRWRRE